MESDVKRLFFGYEVVAPWPVEYPEGRVIEPSSRHLTLAFLGNVEYLPNLEEFPKPEFKVGPVGFFDQCLFLPERHPHVVCWHVQWLESVNHPPILQWLQSHNYTLDDRPFLPHVTIARSPFKKEKWEKAFTPLPMIVKGIHLYESAGNLVYLPIRSFPLLHPFEEIEHTADIAFNIRAESMQGLHLHAQIALAFKFPPFLKYIPNFPLQQNLVDIVIALNELVSQADSDIGCPLKAVSFHGDILNENNIFNWEMIVDV